jgi:general L-amino acid transport system permease protein
MNKDKINLSRLLFNKNIQGVFYQIVTLGLVLLAVFYIFDNTSKNMLSRGLASGYHFLGVESGFDIQMTLIEYSPTSTYFDSFVVGVLNTLLVSGLGIFFASIVGFTIGIARLSPNWLIAKLAETYIEILRNIPLLLQIFFWYFAVLRALPRPKQSMEFLDSFFLNNRGLFIPDPNVGEGATLILFSFLSAIIISIGIAIWSMQRQNKTGERFPVFYSSLGLVISFFIFEFIFYRFSCDVRIPSFKRI